MPVTEVENNKYKLMFINFIPLQWDLSFMNDLRHVHIPRIQSWNHISKHTLCSPRALWAKSYHYIYIRNQQNCCHDFIYKQLQQTVIYINIVMPRQVLESPFILNIAVGIRTKWLHLKNGESVCFHLFSKYRAMAHKASHNVWQCRATTGVALRHRF